MRFHIEGLVVSKEHRGHGIGKKLLKYLEDLALKNSPAIIDLTSSLWREEATQTHSFYRHCGYHNTKQSAYFRKEL